MRSSRKLNDQKLNKVLHDPVLFAEVMLGHDLWSTQHRILQSVAANQRTAVRGAHATGKTVAAVAAALWWITTRSDGVVLMTAPSQVQVEKQLGEQLRLAALGSYIEYPQPTATELRLGPGRYILARSTNTGVRFQGLHGSILILVDEAPGVGVEIFHAIEGIRASGDVRVLLLGNPTVSSGIFYDAFTRDRERWSTISISAFDTPNLAGLTLDQLLALPEDELDQNVRPYLATRRWVREKYDEWGPCNPLWQARVLGEFPVQSEDALFSLAWLEAAKNREGGDGPVVGGLDVAGPGSAETVLCVRRGPRVVLLKAWPNPDPRGEVIAALNPFKNEIKTLNVDTVGIGHGMARHLSDLGFPVNDVNVGAASGDREKYVNLKAELHWGLRSLFEAGDVAELTDEQTIAQLASIRYSYNSRGQIVIESKEQAKKRGIKSPDRADALVLAFAQKQTRDPNFLVYLREELRRRDLKVAQRTNQFVHRP
jgi:hypothetical protein